MQLYNLFVKMEKQITISDLRAVYTKDYDTFGKMDPYLQFTVGKSQGKTEVANRAGKEPKWKAVIVLTYYDQTIIEVKSWEDDTTSRDYMGAAKIDIKSLKASGDLQIKIIEEDGTQSGIVYAKYVVKNLPPVPMLIVRNIKCNFYRDTKLLLNTKPYFLIATNGATIATNHKQSGHPRVLQWDETLRIKLKDGQRINFNVQDKSDNSKIFGYGAFPKQFKFLKGTKKFNVHDRSNQPLGTLQFQFQTLNYTNKEESTKNEQAAKKSSNQLTQINIDTIKGQFGRDYSNLYFKILVGPNLIKTNKLQKGSKQFTMDLKQKIYAQKSENKIKFAAYQQQIVGGDTYYGSGEVFLDSIVQGQNVIKMASSRNDNHGEITVTMTTKNVVHRQVKLSQIKIKNVASTQIIGDSDMYILGQVGGWRCRTQTLTGKQVTYQNDMIFKFSQEKKMKLVIMDQDVDKDDLMYDLELDLEDFKQSGQMRVPLIPQSHKNDKSKHGQLYFKYKTVNNIYKPKKEETKQQKKQEKKTIQESKKEQPKKEQPKKEQHKKDLKKQEPKKDDKKNAASQQQKKSTIQVKKQQPKKQQAQQKKEQKLPSQKKIQPQVQKKEEKLDPNAEKQLCIQSLRGVYLKDFDTFGKMDPFITLSLNKQDFKTQTAHDSGKEPSWKESFIFKYYDDSNLIIKSFDEDVTEKQFMGECKIDTKSLKSSGDLQIKLLSQKGQHIGTIYGKYTLKALPLVPLIVIKNVRCNFYKDTQFILKTKPYLSATTNGVSVNTDPLEKGDSRKLAWNEQLRLKLKDGERINLSVEDKADKGAKIFSYDAFAKQFKTLSGHRKIYVTDKNFQPLGTLEFDYETQNFVSKQQSNKNQQAAKKSESQLTQIVIESIKGNLNKEIYDLYFKIGLGQNITKTTIIDKAPKDFTMDVKQTFYAQKTQNKITFAAFDEEMTKDCLMGSGELLLDNLTNGNNTVKLVNEQNKHIGDIIINAKSKSVPCREITLTDIKVNSKISSDFIGNSQFYVVGKMAGTTRRTETGSGQVVTFKQPLAFKYSQQKQLILDVMDQDVTKDEQIYQVKVNLSQLKEKGQMKVPLASQKYKDDKSKIGQLTFKYDNKNAQPKAEQKKQQTVLKKQQPKKQEPKHEEPKQQKKVEEKKSDRKPIINEKKLEQSVFREERSQNNNSIQKSHLQKSRNTIKLPNIADPKNFGDKIFDKQSAATLQKSIHVYSMPKANRFLNQPKYTGEPTYCTDSSFRPNNGKGVGFGYGTKRQFPDWMERNMKQNPAPGAYFDHHSTTTQFRAKGPTFGLPYKYYEKVTIPKQKPLVVSHIRKSPERMSGNQK